MPHPRERHLSAILLKRFKFFPSVGVLGARQVGKSTFLRDQIRAKLGAEYVSLDLKSARARAENAPSAFLREFGESPLIIDEVQKAPDLFDAIKYEIDTRRRPGRFLVTGSTQFSGKVGIRESLTGRIGILRMLPMTLCETVGDKLRTPWVTSRFDSYFNERQVSHRISTGGMPGICFLRSAEERAYSYDQWLDTTCQRDIHQIRKMRLDGDLAFDILKTLCVLDEPAVPEVARRLGRDARRIRHHLEALEILMVVTRLDPHPSGVGKPRYYVFDSGLAAHLGADRMRQTLIWTMNECLAQHECAGVPARLRYYRSPRGSNIDLFIERRNATIGTVLSDKEAIGTYVLRTAEAFLKKHKGAEALVLAPVQDPYRTGKSIRIIPWRCVA